MKIVIDDKIPFIKGVFEPYANVVYKQGAQISQCDLVDCDAIIIRTRTICNEKLLRNTKVKFIASATIGFDHIDADYCANNAILWTNAAGCNSNAVAEFVLAALLQYSQQKNINLKNQTIGIVGVGNVGSRVENICRILGMNVILCDAPRKKTEKSDQFVDILELAAKADIITFHVPLNRNGIYKTAHLFDEKFCEKTKVKAIINTSRGEIVDTKALIEAIKYGQINFAAIDVWENEPAINAELVSLVNIATPHIAGYSADGKANGTAMSVKAVSKFFQLPLNNWECAKMPYVGDNINVGTEIYSNEKLLQYVVSKAYDIMKDDEMLRKNISAFETLRSHYDIRREFGAFKIFAQNINNEQNKLLNSLGFNVYHKI